MALLLEQVRQKPYAEQMKIFQSDKNLYQQEMARVSGILKGRPDYAEGLKHYASLKAVGSGMDITSVLNGTANLSAYGYNPNATPGFAPPQIPETQDYSSQYQSQIDEALNNLNDVDPFSYDPANDPAFQAYMDLYEAKGQTAFNNQLGAMAGASGGQVSSWASSAASQAQNSYIAQGMSAAPQFMGAAYQRYRDSIGDMQNNLNNLIAMDDREFQQYQQGIENDFNTYNAQMDQYAKSLEFKSSQFQDALERTKLAGYVSNEDAIILGVNPGTPSFEATKAAQDKQTWLEQTAIELKNEKELLAIKFNQEKQLISARGSSSSANEGDYNKYMGKVDSFMKGYDDFIYGDKYSEMTPQEISKKELQFVNQFDATLKALASNPYITDEALAQIWAQIQQSDFYNNVYLKHRGQDQGDNGGWMDAGAGQQ